MDLEDGLVAAHGADDIAVLVPTLAVLVASRPLALLDKGLQVRTVRLVLGHQGPLLCLSQLAQAALISTVLRLCGDWALAAHTAHRAAGVQCTGFPCTPISQHTGDLALVIVARLNICLSRALEVVVRRWASDVARPGP